LAIKKFVDKNTALLGSLFFITSGDIYFYGSIRAGEIDLFYSLFVFLHILIIYYFFQKGHYLFLFLLSYLCCALGFLCKGIPSITSRE
jgi:4-amino-4-deoxy-L-arabinose transferase-like glycosyltransferase